jgi:precorrin-4/cobalt-precorrin-4 C11-methyltransferase
VNGEPVGQFRFAGAPPGAAEPIGKVWFVGAGPGAADLLTLRAADVIARADVVVWAASLVQAEVLNHARQDAEIVDSSQLRMEGVLRSTGGRPSSG